MLKHCIALIIMLMSCPMLIGQEYVYPVATGISWARELYESDGLNNEWELEQSGTLPDDAPDIKKIFSEFEHNYRLYNLYNDSIFMERSNPEWIGLFLRRAKTYAQIYEQNNKNIERLIGWLRQGNVSEVAYHQLYQCIRHLYHSNIFDLSLASQGLDILISHYESVNDYEHLMLCYVSYGFYKEQTSCMGLASSAGQSVEYYTKALALGRYFGQFRNPFNRFYFIAAFVNLAVLHTQLGNFSFSQSQQLREDIMAFCQKPENAAIIEQDPRLKEFYDWSICLTNMRGLMTYISHDLDDFNAFAQLYASYQDQRAAFGDDLRHLKHRYYAKVEYDDLLIDAYAGRISWDVAFDRFVELCDTDPELDSGHKIESYRLNYICNLFISFLYLTDHTAKSYEEKATLIRKALNSILVVISNFDHIQYPTERGFFLSNLATNPRLLKYLTQEEQSQLLNCLVVVGQPVTYVHVSMVTELTRILASAILDEQPEYFIGVPGYETADDVRQHRDDLLNFVTHAATYHDLGKIHIPTIISNCFRRLSNEEFLLIKQHPQSAMDFFDTYEFISQYRDIALGHHKWYDGGGYPTSFDNRSSRLFPLINIVTLCDCMDAATENIGRNYHTPKSFETVMAEFEEGAGTRYDPFLITFVNQHPELYRQLKQKVLLGRMDHYMQLFSTLRNF